MKPVNCSITYVIGILYLYFTGGNSGSGMFDGNGRLIGLAFDGNWEAMSGDLKFDNRLQRTIGVDIRYVLSVIEKYSKGKRIINELTLE